jgi:energy-coupling factor transporter transmembrane protein EcfT
MPDITMVRFTPKLHAASWLAIWFMWLLAGQGGPGGSHEAWAFASIVAALVFAPIRFIRLLRRLRWLLLAVMLTFAFGTPGRLVVADFTFGPTFEGLTAALHSITHLVAMAASVAVLLNGLSPARLTGAIHRLIHPLSHDQPSPDSFALRLQLVLRDLEVRFPGRDWRSWLDDDDGGDLLAVETCAPLALFDAAMMIAAAALLAVRGLA